MKVENIVHIKILIIGEGVTLSNIMLILLLGPPVENKLIFFIRLF